MSISKWVSENPIIIILISIILPVIAFEIGECATFISRTLINIGSWFLGVITTRQAAQIYREDWLALLATLPGKLTKILLTCSILARAIPRLWWILMGRDIPADIREICDRRFVRWYRASNSPRPGVQVARLDRGHVAIKSARSKPKILVFSVEEMHEF